MSKLIFISVNKYVFVVDVCAKFRFVYILDTEFASWSLCPGKVLSLSHLRPPATIPCPSVFFLPARRVGTQEDRSVAEPVLVRVVSQTPLDT